ncbi:MAG: type VI secretion system contractile sheath small subunit [Myxococcales bacterium FL481]|nr:MAG: type VI secretion system contractile sheath small subunit [Myxococcales bacterium FL481]
MANEASVAPKERVNIVYKPATSGSPEVELPLKMLMLGDFTGKPDDRTVEDRKPINVDKDNFADVMKEHNLGASVNVADKLSGNDGAEMSVNLSFQGLGDFSPEGIARQVPELQKLLDLRNALGALKGPLGNIPAFRRKIQDLLKDGDARTQLMSELGLDNKSDD